LREQIVLPWEWCGTGADETDGNYYFYNLLSFLYLYPGNGAVREQMKQIVFIISTTYYPFCIYTLYRRALATAIDRYLPLSISGM